MLKGDTSKMFEELRKENQTLQLQRKYEEGSLQEEELSISQKEELLALYQKQIANLEITIKEQKETFARYKKQIQEKRKKQQS